jgi:hypothetical protein
MAIYVYTRGKFEVRSTRETVYKRMIFKMPTFHGHFYVRKGTQPSYVSEWRG